MTVKKAVSKSCNTCIHHFDGVCRKRVCSALTIQGEIKSWFPPVKDDWWCGEFAPSKN